MSYLLRRTAISTLFVFGLSLPAFGRSVTVAWNANKETDLSGYVIRYGTSSRTYTASVNVGNRTTFALTLDDFTTYYVAVEAYNIAGGHSVLSSEVVVGPDYSTCGFKLNTASAAVGGAASSMTVALSAQSACPWSAVSYSSWIRVAGRTATRGSGTVSLAISANDTATPRVGTVVIGTRSLLITQTSGSCAVAPLADYDVFPRDGGSGSISVSASGTQCGWTVSSDASWVTIAGMASRSGAGTVAFTIASNAGDAREAHLTVAGTVFTIAQRARQRGDALDFDGRGADVFLYSRATGGWTRYQWDGSLVTLQTGVSTPGMTVIPGDLNGDQRSDLFAYDTRTGIWAYSISASDGTVRFTEAVGDPGWVPTVVDLNGDGRSDVFLYNPQSGEWAQWIINATTLLFSERRGHFNPGWTVYRARFDSNTRDDLFLYNARSKSVDSNAGKWVRVFTQADLTFTAKAGATVWPAGATILPVDFSGDGLSEVFSLSPTGTWTVATFSATGVTYTSGSWTPGWQVFRGEFSGDRVPDLLLVKPATGEYRVAIRKATAFDIVAGTWSKNALADVTDLNGDGLTDVLLYSPAEGVWGSAIWTTKQGAFVFGGGNCAKSRTLLARHQTAP